MAEIRTATHKRVMLSIEEKSRRLQVSEIAGEANRLQVSSGTQAGVSYTVDHDGKNATRCTCRAMVPCSHRLAGEWYLEAQKRNMYTEMFGIYAAYE